MLLTGRSIIPEIVSNVRSAIVQEAPCGVDLTLKQIERWTSSGHADFDYDFAPTEEIPFEHNSLEPDGALKDLSLPEKHTHKSQGPVMLGPGAYLVEFNEMIRLPASVMGQIISSRTVFRSGALLSSGEVDSGYTGEVGATLQVVNPHGLRLF
ncbi:hypothetical protein MMC20_000216 [Loxospora ochrophaea]|nr:hypothetical protein [Loxospora ochrophaea]